MKTRKLRMEPLQRREMLSVSPLPTEPPSDSAPQVLYAEHDADNQSHWDWGVGEMDIEADATSQVENSTSQYVTDSVTAISAINVSGFYRGIVLATANTETVLERVTMDDGEVDGSETDADSLHHQATAVLDIRGWGYAFLEVSAEAATSWTHTYEAGDYTENTVKEMTSQSDLTIVAMGRFHITLEVNAGVNETTLNVLGDDHLHGYRKLGEANTEFGITASLFGVRGGFSSEAAAEYSYSTARQTTRYYGASEADTLAFGWGSLSAGTNASSELTSGSLDGDWCKVRHYAADASVEAGQRVRASGHLAVDAFYHGERDNGYQPFRGLSGDEAVLTAVAEDSPLPDQRVHDALFSQADLLDGLLLTTV